MPPIVAYYRVSTQRQGVSGLGLDAQQHSVREYATRTGQAILAEYTEIESGRRCDRPKLAAALPHARYTGSVLVVAKLDRLARDARFLLGLCDSGVSLLFLDLPDLPADPITGRLILTVMAGIAEFESRRISQRIKEAFARKRARGEMPPPMPSAWYRRSAAHYETMCRNAAIVHRQNAAAFRAEMRLIARGLQCDGGKSLRELADALNSRGYRTRRGKPWTLATVWELLRDRDYDVK